MKRGYFSNGCGPWLGGGGFSTSGGGSCVGSGNFSSSLSGGGLNCSSDIVN